MEAIFKRPKVRPSLTRKRLPGMRCRLEISRAEAALKTLESGNEINSKEEGKRRKKRKTRGRGNGRDVGGEGVPALYQRRARVAIGFGFFAKGSQWKRDQSFLNGQNA